MYKKVMTRKQFNVLKRYIMRVYIRKQKENVCGNSPPIQSTPWVAKMGKNPSEVVHAEFNTSPHLISPPLGMPLGFPKHQTPVVWPLFAPHEWAHPWVTNPVSQFNNYMIESSILCPPFAPFKHHCPQ